MKQKFLLKTMLLLFALIAGSSSVWATTYKLTSVTSVSAGNKYVFVRNSHALSNSVSSSALQTIGTYSTTGLAGTETYVWLLETAEGGFYMKNVSLNSNQYINNPNSTNISFGNKSSIWTITFDNGVALIQNTSNANRYLGETGSSSNQYKAYATSNMSYGHDFTVYVLEEEAADPEALTIWSENFSDYSANDVPSGGTYNYVCVNGGSDTKIYADVLAGGTSPELLVGKNTGSFTATIPLDKYEGSLKLAYKTNAKSMTVSTTTEGISGSGTFSTAGTHEVTFTGITASTSSITIVFTPSSDNVRLDDIVLKGRMAAPVFSPAAGDVVAGTNVTLSATTGAAIYYTTNGDTPTSSSTLYSSAITINATTTIKALAIKDGKKSNVATGTFNVSADPFLALSTTTVEATKSETMGAITVTYGNLTNYLADVYFYEADGTTPATYDWIDAEINATTKNLDYLISENTTYAARTAYLKVYAVGDEGAVYSDLITFTQAGKAVDYAILPFAFDGGNAELFTGLTGSGLGGDYGSSPKLKFDGAGDYLILKINEVPGTLAFDIKGNGSGSDPWAGTFKVQTSVDGESYSDLKAYTSLGDKTTEKFILGSTVRYIKWVYTNKSIGNVALGNINLSAYSSTISITPAKEYTTLTCPYPLDFSGVTGLEAYIATEVSGGSVLMTQVNNVPANTGLVIKKTGSAASYDVPVLTGAAEDVTANKMAGSAIETTAIAANAGYILSNGVFQPSSGGDLPAGKAYLNITYSPTAPVLNLSFGDDTTGIKVIDNGQLTIDNYYNLAGQRVTQPTKGLYIVNGKKVVIK